MSKRKYGETYCLDIEAVEFLTDLFREAIFKKMINVKMEEESNFRDNYVGSDIESSFKVENENNIYHIVFAQWNCDDRYSLIVYSEDYNLPILGRYTCKIIDEEPYFYFKYYSVKRDGKNNYRKEIFKEKYGDDEVLIKLPLREEEVQVFIDEIIKLADTIIEVNIKASQMDI